MTPQNLQQIATAYKNDHDNKAGYSRLNQVDRLKNTTPISQRLNNFIEEKYKEYQKEYTIFFTEDDDFDPEDLEGTLQKHLDRFDKKVIYIWTGASEGTIFGEPTINHKFRLWHDVEHFKNKLGYDYLDESIVCEIQKNQLPNEWVFEKELIHAEITGQAQYFMKNDSFVPNQRLFTRDYINNPIKALK